MKKVFYDKYGKLHEIWSISGAAVLLCTIFIILALLLAGVFSVMEAGECAKLKSYESQHDYRWSLFTGCMVQTEAGYWVDSDNPTLLELEQGE